MIAILTLIYTAIVVVIFKVMKVKPRPWPIAGVVTGGVLMLGMIVIFWTVSAPLSSKAVVSRYVVQIVPYVKGQVTSIPALPNVPLKKGDVLYEVDPTPYQNALNQVQAQVQAAKSNVQQLEAGIRVAKASVEKATADVAAAKAAFEVATAVNRENPQAISKLKLVEAEENYAGAQATLGQAQASQEQATLAVAAAKDQVSAAEAQLASAQFDLQECTVTAPTDGFVTDWQIREGTFVVPMPFAAAGTYIDTSDTIVVASYPAQMLVNVKPDQKVELAFKSKPGRLYTGTVDTIIQATGEGQFATGGKLPSAASLGSPGILAVKIRLDEGQAVDDLEMGTAGVVAIYTDFGKSFGMISKVTIRMKKWLFFLPFG